MDKFKALEIVSRFAPELTLRDAMDMIDSLSGLATTGTSAEKVSPFNDVQVRANAARWAGDNFSQWDRENKKIQCIKVLREKFALGLKEAKDIMDAHLSYTVHNYRFV